MFAIGLIQSNLGSAKSKAYLDDIYGSWVFFKRDDVFHEDKIVPRFSEYLIYDEGQGAEITGNLLGGWFIPISTIIWKKAFWINCEGRIANQDVDP